MKKTVFNISMLVIPLVTLIIAEILQGSFLPNLFPAVINYLIIAVPCWIIYFISNSFALSVLPPTALVLFFAVTNHYVIFFRNAALQPWDIVSAASMTTLSSSITLFIDASVLFAIFWMITLIAASLFKVFKSPGKRSLKSVTAIIIALFFLIPSVISFHSTSRDDFWDTVSASRRNGFVLNFISNMRILHNTAPDGYSSDKLHQIKQLPSPELSPEPLPDVIVVMNEAFSDLSVYSKPKTNRDPLEYFHSLENVYKGNLIVPVFGGGTCNTEYEFLTGNSCFMLRNGSYPMQQFVNRASPSIASILKAQGYETTAVHPYYPNGWNRSTAYPLLGFDRFISLDDMFDPEIIRQFASDSYTYDRIFEITNNSQKPQFVFCVTMQNHLGYDIEYENFKEDIFFTDGTDFPQAKQYLSLLDESDKALKKLIEHYKNAEKPTYILFFGDHQPSLESEFIDSLLSQTDKIPDEINFTKYTVPFFIWYNKGAVEAQEPLISVNYLGSVLLKTLGLKTTPYNNFLLEMMKTLPVLSSHGIINSEQEHFSINEHPYEHFTDLYNNLQYNLVFDKENRQEELFNIH